MEFDWDHQTIGDVYSAVRKRRAEILGYINDNKAAGLGDDYVRYAPQLERLDKAQQDLWSKLNND
jgi:hypothetical protein